MSSPKKQDDEMEPPPPPYPAHTPSPLDIKPRKRPDTESAFQSIRDPESLAKLVGSVGEFEAAQEKEGLERRNEEARRIIRRKIAQRAQGIVSPTLSAEAEEKEEEGIDKDMEVGVESEGNEDIEVDQPGTVMPPTEEWKVDDQHQGQHQGDNHGEPEVGGDEEGREEGGENEPAKKKKKKKSKKKKSKSPSSAPIPVGANASWAKGVGSAPTRQELEMGQVENEVDVSSPVAKVEHVIEVPQSTVEIEQSSPVKSSSTQSSTVSDSPLSEISNETPISPDHPTRGQKKRRNKRPAVRPLEKKLADIEDSKSAIIDIFQTIPEAIEEGPEPDPEPAESPKKIPVRVDLAEWKKEADRKTMLLQKDFLPPNVLHEMKQRKKNANPPIVLYEDGSKELTTPARRLDFGMIEMDVKPKAKKIIPGDLVQKIKPKNTKGGMETEKVENIRVEAESVVTEPPLDLTVDDKSGDSEDTAIVLSSPPPKPVIERIKSAPEQASAWSLLKSGGPPSQNVVPADKVPILMDIIKTGTVTSTTKIDPKSQHVEPELKPELASPPQINIIKPSDDARRLVVPNVNIGVTFTASPEGGVTGPMIEFGELTFVDKIRPPALTAAVTIIKTETEAETSNAPIAEATAEADTPDKVCLKPLPNQGIPSTSSEPAGVEVTDTEGVDMWNKLVEESDSDDDTVLGDPSPPQDVGRRVETANLSVVQNTALGAFERDTPPEQDLVTPHDVSAPAFPKQSYPKSPLHTNASRLSSYRTASVNVPSPLGTTITGPEDEELVPTRQNTPESDTTPTQSQIIVPPLVRRLESVDSSMDIGMPAEVDYSNPMSVKNVKMDKGYTLYFTKSAPKESSPPGVSPKVYPPLGVVDVKQYTGGLIPVFTAFTFGDFFGSWLALRRRIAESVHRPIEPAHRGMLAPGTEGLGLHLCQSDKTAHFFIEGIRPAWEDPMCSGGGKIVMLSNPAELDHMFFKTALNLIAGVFDTSCPPPVGRDHQVIGAVLVKREASRPRLDIWLGGKDKVSNLWADGVIETLRVEYPKAEVYRYKPHYNAAGGVTPSGPGPKRAGKYS